MAGKPEKRLVVEYDGWREYEEATAEVFRKLGCNAQVNFQARGVRATHAVDVYATFIRSGITCSWVIECKLWKSRVTKEKVLALKSIVEDLGADRGIIVSEAGFQAGARDAARGSNITLVTSLQEFSKTAVAGTTEVPMVLNEEELGEPIYQFPDKSGPANLLGYGEWIISANWEGCSISIINPVSKSIVRTIELDKYESFSPRDNNKKIRSHPSGGLVIADGRLFVGQVFSEVILVIDLATHSIVKRISVPGGGEGNLAASQDGKLIYFASNKLSQFYIIDTATYAFQTVAYPEGGRGCMSLLRHPTLPLLYIGIQRGGRIAGRRYPHANCYVATYDLHKGSYIAETQLAEIEQGQTDDATPACLTYDETYDRIYVGMFQSKRGICIIDPSTGASKQDLRFKPNKWDKFHNWVDPLSQALSEDYLLSLNRNNRELAVLNRASLEMVKTVFLGDSMNGPKCVLVWNQQAIISYPARNGLIFLPLDRPKQT